jgi:DNA-binding MarR family transcriptional regulator
LPGGGIFLKIKIIQYLLHVKIFEIETIDPENEPMSEPIRDQVDELLDRWNRERPDLDPSPMAVMARIIQLEQQRELAWQELTPRSGLKPGEFDVLAALRSSGPSYELSPTALFRSLCLSSGAMTNRLDRLETRGLIQRRPDPEDRRAIVIGLTPAGRELVDRTVVDMLDGGAKLLAGLTAEEQTTLANLLRKLLVSLGLGAPSLAAGSCAR